MWEPGAEDGTGGFRRCRGLGEVIGDGEGISDSGEERFVRVSSCCDGSMLSSCGKPSWEYDSTSGTIACDSVSIWDVGMLLVSVTFQCREPFGVTRGVSTYGSDSCDSKYCGGGWDCDVDAYPAC